MCRVVLPVSGLAVAGYKEFGYSVRIDFHILSLIVLGYVVNEHAPIDQQYHEYQKEHGFSPTYAELAKELSVSTITVFEHLEALERKGAIRRRRHEARSVEIIEEDFLRKQGSYQALAVKGNFTSGQPVENFEEPEDLSMGTILGAPGHNYMLRVKGNSLIGDHILDGDLLILENRDTAAEGEMVLGTLENGQTVLRRYFRDNGRIRLQSASPNIPPIYLDHVKVQGVLKGLIRRVH